MKSYKGPRSECPKVLTTIHSDGLSTRCVRLLMCMRSCLCVHVLNFFLFYVLLFLICLFLILFVYSFLSSLFSRFFVYFCPFISLTFFLTYFLSVLTFHLPLSLYFSQLPDTDAPYVFCLPDNIERSLQRVTSSGVIKQLRALSTLDAEASKFDREKWRAQVSIICSSYCHFQLPHLVTATCQLSIGISSDSRRL